MNNKKFNYTYLLVTVVSILFIKCNKGPEFNKLLPFQEKEDGRWGYVNFKGKKVIETKFTNQPSIFFEGMALVTNMDDTYDFINRKGIDMGKSFKSATYFNDGVACAVEKDHYPVIINKDLDIVAKLDSVEKVSYFSEGFAAFMNKEDKWGFMNTSGEIVIEPIYYSVELFSEGLALVKKKTEEYDSIKNKNITKISMGFINRNGDEVIKLSNRFDKLSSFSEGMAAYSDGAEWGWGFINKRGKKVIRANAEWDDITLFHNGFSSVKIDGSWGLINKNGKLIIKPKYDYPLYFSNGLASIEIEDKIGFISSKDKKVIEPYYDEIAIPFYSGISFVKSDQYFRIINKRGKQLNDVELYDLSTYSDYDHYIRSDYFDTSPIIDSLFTELSSNAILGLNAKSNVKSVMDKFDISEANLPKNTWRDNISLSSVNTKDANVSRTVTFTSNVSEPIKRRVRYSSYYSYYKTVGYRPNSESFVESLKFNINLTKRGRDKEEKLAVVFRQLLEANGYLIEEESKENIFNMVSQNKDCSVIIDYNENSKVSLSFNF